VRTKRRQAGDRRQLGGARKVADLVLIVQAVDRRSKPFAINLKIRHPWLKRRLPLMIARPTVQFVPRFSERNIVAQGASPTVLFRANAASFVVGFFRPLKAPQKNNQAMPVFSCNSDRNMDPCKRQGYRGAECAERWRFRRARRGTRIGYRLRQYPHGQLPFRRNSRSDSPAR
jgi:hypothetical protein